MLRASRIATIIYGSLLCFDASNALIPRPRTKAQRNTHIRQPTSQITATSPSVSRRDALRYAFLISPIVSATMQPARSNALEACRPKLHNCIRTAWKAPSSVTSRAEAAQTVRDALNSYPQKGQAGVDCSGWKIVSDALDDADSGVMKLEYKSCVGPAALAINLGQPFVDDLKLELGKNDSDGSITVEVKSSSRMGSGDLFVNRKRLEYLGKILKEKGWSVPYPKYAYES